MFISKKYKENLSKYDLSKEYHLDDAIDILHSFNHSKFDESVDISVNLGVDPKHSDQLVRGTVSLPNGTGKKVKVIVIAKDDAKNKKAKELGAIEAGSEELIDKIKQGWLDFLLPWPDHLPVLLHGKLSGRYMDCSDHLFLWLPRYR